jgi:hypothetical protein
VIPEPPAEKKNGIVEVKGVLYYYENDKIAYCAGLVQLEDGAYIYVRSNGQLALGKYWPTVTNGLLSAGMYDFGEDGKYYPVSEEPEEPDVPVVPDVPEEPDVPAVKNGVVEEDGALYYYVDGVRTYAGLVQLEDGAYIYVRSNGQLATGVYWPSKHNDLLPYKGYDFGEDGKLYL